jgi:hypothetical protein
MNIYTVKPVYSGHLGENDKMTTIYMWPLYGGFEFSTRYWNVTIVSEWKSKLPNLIKDYHPRDIYNMDETGLFNITLR